MEKFLLPRANGQLGFELMVDWKRHSIAIRCNTAFVDGIDLEQIHPGVNGLRPGMMLVKNGWRRTYLVREREGWTDDEYFDLAEKLMLLRGIERP